MNARLVEAAPATSDSSSVPLVIDLDGTLIRTDLLHESLVRLAFSEPASLAFMVGWLVKGKAYFKRQVASRVAPNAATLPYEPAVVDWIRSERDSGRTVVLCTASDERHARAVARETDLFDVVMASDGTVNLAGERKAAALVARYGDKGFDYAGNSGADLPVWRCARRAIVVGASPRVRAAAQRIASVDREFSARSAPVLATWSRALRLRQWVKNVLVFLPLFGAHEFSDPTSLMLTAIAFLAFSLCASAVYLANDIFDIESDRLHPRKRTRPFAAGLIPLTHGIAVSMALVVAAFSLAFFGVNNEFTVWLAAYLALTTCYSAWLKRKILVDSLVLAMLYTLRLLAGAAAASIDTGFWLLAFSMFLFLSLALVKRYAELDETFRRGGARTPGRDYRIDDLPLVQTLGIVAGFSAVIVLALYINGDTVARLYPHQQLIWCTVPVLLYWISRVWLKAHRGELDDDPIVFALSDDISRATILLFFLALLMASVA